MSSVETFDVKSESIRVGEWIIERSEAIFLFIVGMLLGLFIFFFTLRIFDGIIRPKYFPALPSVRSPTDGSRRNVGRMFATAIDRYRGLA